MNYSILSRIPKRKLTDIYRGAIELALIHGPVKVEITEVLVLTTRRLINMDNNFMNLYVG